MAVGTFVLLPVMVAGGVLLLKVWKGKARHPESLSANEREIVSACLGMAVGLREQADSGETPSKEEVVIVVRGALEPVVQRVTEYMESEDYVALRMRSRVRLRRVEAAWPPDRDGGVVVRWIRRRRGW